MRGKVEAAILAMERNGITPACAGKSNQITPVSRRGEDHPRVCGEKRQIWYKMLCCGGSPPRVRGKGALSGGRAHLPWITPACAGKSLQQGGRSNIFWDHPRVCGEKGKRRRIEDRQRGSPPRVRGKVLHPLPVIDNYQDHPRVCGEKTKKSP